MPKRDVPKPKFSNLLHGLPERLLAPLFVDASQKELPANATLFAVGDAGDGCYRIERGLVKVAMTSPTGEERIISLLGPGAIVGELSMIDGLARSASVSALQDSVLRFVSRQTFLDFAKAHPEMHQQLVSILATRLREANEALMAATFLPAKARVARALLEIAEHMGKDSAHGRIVLNQKVNQADIASLAGVARENVSRALSGWRKRRLITRTANQYCINDIAALQSEVEFGA
jgi:CRP-like cAMP-binding protein